MLIFKLVSHLLAAMIAFTVGSLAVAAVSYMVEPTSLAQNVDLSSKENKTSSGIYFTAPSLPDQAVKGCDSRSGEIYPFGWDTYLSANQIPEIRRKARDGRWFFFETKDDNGRSFEFFGIIPDSANNLSGNEKVVIPGKLIRLTKGEVTGNIDASYLAPVCSFQ
jgi:hypothetical protein